MLTISIPKGWARPLAAAGVLLASLAAGHAARAAGPTAQPPYRLSLFARSAGGYSQPDSIVQWRDSVIVGFGNHVAKDGSDGKSSTIVEYGPNGNVRRTFSTPGHNDGLHVIFDRFLWCLQNEDGNPNLVVIDLVSGQKTQYGFPASALAHGGGFDDIAVLDGKVFFSVSAPTLDKAGNNVFPALVRVSLPAHGNTLKISPVLAGNASAVDIPTGTAVTLNLTDPDSLSVDPRGNLVLTSQADAELVFVRGALSSSPQAGRLPLTTGGAPVTIDDTQFATGTPGSYLLVTDLGGDAIYRIAAGAFGWEPGTAYSASDTAGIVGVLDLDNGVVTPVATGFGSARGLLFVTPFDPDGDQD
jgi:hypothetical protein